MTTAIRTSGKHGALLIAGILMIATTLRVTFTGAAPLLDTIRLDYGLSVIFRARWRSSPAPIP